MSQPLFGDKYPSAKEVADFHRNADTDRDENAIHHKLGKTKNQASPGNHTHDGGNSEFLFDQTGMNAVIFTENLTTTDGMKNAMKKVITALTYIGAVDNSIS